MAKLCKILLLCLGSTITLRHGSRLADGQRTFTVSLDITGEAFGDESIVVTKDNFYHASVVEGQTLMITGLPAGKKVKVQDSSNVGSCTYETGKDAKTCRFSKWTATWATHEEPEEEPAPPEKRLGWKVMFFVDGKGPPFEIKINNVTVKEPGPIQGTWLWMTDVAGAGVVVSMVVPSTNAECTYTVGKVKKTCSVEGYTTEFETARSKEYDPNEATDEFGWLVRVTLEGFGPGFEITADDVAFFEEPDESFTPRRWEQFAEIGTTGTPVQIVFSDDTIIEYETGAQPDDFDLKGYKIKFESIKKNRGTRE